MNNDPKRRLSRPEVSGISAIFNPRKQLRRSSTAISQLLGSTGRPPSVVITDDNLSEIEYGCSSMVGVVGVGMANGPHGRDFNVSVSGGGGGVGGGGLSAGGLGGSTTSMHCGPASSTPLLADVQQQSGQIVTVESSLINNPSQPNVQQPVPGANNTNLKPIAKTIATIKRAIFSKTARKLCCGVILSILVGFCWTLLIHSIKRCLLISHLFPVERSPAEDLPSSSTADPFRVEDHVDPYGNLYPHTNNKHLMLDYQKHLNISPGDVTTPETTAIKPLELQRIYDAPFFTAWILTISTIAFYPIHQVTVRFCSCMGRKGPKSMSRAISDAVQGFRERGMTLFQFLGRCAVLCGLWLFTNYLIVYSLRILRATEVLALFATTTSFVYLLSWVVLHQQFVGLRILAVILSNMGIALFAYMDGQARSSKSVGGVILGALAAGISAVFKVSLKKMFGVGATISQQVALIFSVMGIISLVFLWPIFLTLYFTGFEVIRWDYFPWDFIAGAIFASLVVAMLDNFGVTCTFEFFITVGLFIAIPFTAVADQQLYYHEFDGMCLGGIITISIGFVVVLLPENWPDYITRLIRYLARLKRHSRWGRNRRGFQQQQEPVDTRTGHIRSHLRSPSGRVR